MFINKKKILTIEIKKTWRGREKMEIRFSDSLFGCRIVVDDEKEQEKVIDAISNGDDFIG